MDRVLPGTAAQPTPNVIMKTWLTAEAISQGARSEIMADIQAQQFRLAARQTRPYSQTLCGDIAVKPGGMHPKN